MGTRIMQDFDMPYGLFPLIAGWAEVWIIESFDVLNLARKLIESFHRLEGYSNHWI